MSLKIKHTTSDPIDSCNNITPYDRASFASYDSFYFPHTVWKKPTISFSILPAYYNIDISQIQKDLAPFLPRLYPARSETSVGHYYGYGFTHRKGSENENYDAISMFAKNGRYTSTARMLNKKKQLIKLDPNRNNFEKDFTDLTDDAPSSLKNYLKKFNSEITKVRLLSLSGGFGIKPHVDLPYYEQMRIHIPIFSNANVVWYVEDKSYQLPANGSSYWYDVGRSHSILNYGKTDRTVLCIHLLVYKKRDGSLRFNQDKNISEIIDQLLL